MEELRGYVNHIVFKNEDNGYTVFDFECDDRLLMCVGMAGTISEGDMLLIKAELVDNKTYGQQYRIMEYQILPPEDIKSIERYLGSGAIKGIGEALAARIIRRFKEDAIRIIEEEPERLAEVKGISEKKAREIAAQVINKRDLRAVIMQLQKYGIEYRLATRLYAKYGLKIVGMIEENPYRLAEEVAGIGFVKADEIAKSIGIGANSDFRIRCGILYVLQKASLEGHMYLPREIMLNRAEELLRVPKNDIDRLAMDLCIDKKVYIKQMRDEIRIYASQSYFVEMNVAQMIKDLNVSYDVDRDEIFDKINDIERREEISLDEKQREAVLEAAQKGLLVITGGPGTGKTTTIKTIIHYFESQEMELFLAAPTGRAAKRMTEATGYEAQTLHRLLELSGGLEGEVGAAEFAKNEKNPLETDVIIVDEASMVDMFLMNNLLKAVVVGTRVIFVGDVNQLPSVGPGSVLKDMIECEKLPVVCLTKIFRQAMESDIVKNAHKINYGENVDLDNKKSKDFFFIHQSDSLIMQRALLSLVQEKLPKYVNASSYDIQVLTPMRKGIFGVNELNSMLQRYLNPSDENKAEKESGGCIFREGDKVMQIKNNYQLQWKITNKYNVTVEEGMGVFNGDIGIIESIDSFLEKMTIVFDENRRVDYPFKQLDELELAYAITVHKSQGSEYPAVVMPLFYGPRPLMNRNLLYTAVTRAKNCVAMVGDAKAFNYMLENVSENRRYSGLKDFLTL